MGGKYQRLKGQKRKHFKSPNTSLAKILIFPMTIRENTKVELLGCMTGVAAIGWGTSPQFRCASLLVIPKFLGKEGRLYILTYMLAAVYDGPVANIRHNLGEVVRSISCTVELQIENAKKAWKISLAPMRKILKDMVRSGKTLRTESQEVSRSFTELNKQVASRAGTESRLVREADGSASTQEVYEAKTRMRCQLMNSWCRDKIPVEGNFGQTYDRVNDSVENLNQDFTASVVIQEERQEMLVGANLSSHKHLVDDVNEQVYQSSKQLGTAVTMLRVLLSCMFILVFASAYSYTNKYNEDIRFDNLYISRYFRQIDARRRKQKKRTLLPLRRAEESRVIEPLRLAFQPAETKSVVSSHHLEVKVGGETLMARLLRSTIGALNTSSEMVMETNNLQCLPEPRGMSRDDYVKCATPLGALVVLCFLQVYVFRLRRVIAAFYFPKREKKRIIYLYNEMLRRRVAFVLVQRKRIILQARRRKRVRKPLLNRIGRCCPFLKRILLRRCILCNRPESRHSLTCSNPECETVYCRICWKDMGKTCFACHPEDLVSEDESSEGETGYAD
ncbi:E3 ubiquitin-protein ligase DCST1 [Protobothrops mucrosquamatus]|uniref:E3 ubiquitin-protein ligase DCST1 n=1 Tax=Protobothrops mucrosquamatus TaxID=103944 RepID=UPI000775ACC2|nr:E3 ubiquitin-protein ligase DCST1 [Protobothrops mucrosquamatus]